MRFQTLVHFLVLVGLAFAWTKEDHEIFDLVSALEAAEGKGTTFYSLLDIEPSASLSVLNKAYRKKSLQMHPDKNPGVKDIQARFARLGVIAAILRSPEGRERYNFFFKNGVPKWRGTGYYYSRYRPTLSHTLIFLVFLTSLAHLLVMRLNYGRDKRRVEYFERSARAAAGAPRESKTIVGAGTKRRRRVKVPMVQGSDQGGVLELVVEDDAVYLPGDDGDIPLSTLAQKPSISRTWPVLLTLSLTHKCTSHLPPSIQGKLPSALLPHHLAYPHYADESRDDEDEDESGEGPDDTPTPAPRNKVSQLKRQERLQGKNKGASAKANGKAVNGDGGATTTTPLDSPAGTDFESVDDSENVDSDAPQANGAQRKKKAGLGKSGGARRRKMAMKK